MRTIERSDDEMVKAIGYAVLELERTGCAITAEAISERLGIVLNKNTKVAKKSVKPSKQPQFNEPLCS